MWRAEVLVKTLYRKVDLCTMRVDKEYVNFTNHINTGNIRGVAKFIHKFDMYGELFLSIYALESNNNFTIYETCNQGRCSNQEVIGGTQHNPFRLDSEIGALEFVKGGGIWYSWKNLDDNNDHKYRIIHKKVIIEKPTSIEENDILDDLSQQLQTQVDKLNLQCGFEKIDYQPIRQMFNIQMLKKKTNDDTDDDDDDDDEWN